MSPLQGFHALAVLVVTLPSQRGAPPKHATHDTHHTTTVSVTSSIRPSVPADINDADDQARDKTMTGANWRSWLFCATLVGLLPGCRHFFADTGPPQDPLFARRPPEPAKAEFAPPVAIAFSDPIAPQDPVLAKTRPPYPGRQTPGVLTSHPNSSKE
jgi:hypothetical protein